MAKRRFESSEDARRYMAEQLWLNYFNQVLYEQNLITEDQRNRMIHKIASREPSPAKPEKKEKDLEM